MGWGGWGSLQELLSHRAGKGGEVRQNVCELAAWHSYHGTNSPGSEETAANCRTAREGHEQRGAMRVPPFLSPSPSLVPDPDGQSASVPSGAQMVGW